MIKLFRALVFTVIVLLVAYLLLPTYLQRAVLYLHANIDDYEIFENRTVAASKPQPWPFSEQYNQYQLGEAYEDTLKSYETTAFLIIKDSAISFEHYYEGYDAQSIFNSFSAAKSIISLLVGIAIFDTDIESVFQPVSDFIPSFSEGDKANITIRDLLTMSSGLKWNESYANPFSVTTEAYYGSDLKGLVNSVASEELSGQRFEYKSIDTQILAEVLEIATGQSVSDYAANRLWRKVGAENDALWSLDKAGGMEKAFCCFNSTARDFARIGQLVLNNGQWNDGVQVVHPDYILMATTAAAYSGENSMMDYYGYQWWILNYKGKMIPYARGILGQYIFVLKDKNAVAVRLGKSRSNVLINNHPSDVYTYVDAAYELLK
jgi:CubicO group peptidase (beta-lactamase class C family)